jgi:hypothetical protein
MAITRREVLLDDRLGLPDPFSLDMKQHKLPLAVLSRPLMVGDGEVVLPEYLRELLAPAAFGNDYLKGAQSESQPVLQPGAEVIADGKSHGEMTQRNQSLWKPASTVPVTVSHRSISKNAMTEPSPAPRG